MTSPHSGKKIAIVLSGCGYLDGSEITEAVSTLIGVSQAGAQYQCFAPENHFTPVDHVSGEASKDPQRIPLTEAARIARGNIKPLAELLAKDFDAVIFPGGFGAAKVLSTWASEGAKAAVLPNVQRVIEDFHKADKPIGAICIAPNLLALTLGKKGPTLTIGNDKETAQEIQKTGARHEECSVRDYVTDREHKIVTTPAYMYGDARPEDVFKGIQGLCKEIVEMS